MSENSTINRAVTNYGNAREEDRKNLENEVIFITKLQHRLNIDAQAYKTNLIRLYQEQQKLRANDRTRLNLALNDYDLTRIALDLTLRKLNFHVSTAHEITQKYYLKGEEIAEYTETVDRVTGEIIKTPRRVENTLERTKNIEKGTLR